MIHPSSSSSIMKSSLLLPFCLSLLTAATSDPQNAQAVLHASQQALVEPDNCLIELSPGVTKWVTEDDKLALRRQNVNFFDITNNQELGAMNNKIGIRSLQYPPEVTYKDTVTPLLDQLRKDNLYDNLETFTSFHTRYYKSQYGIESSAWLLSQVNKTIAEAGTSKVSVRAFPHPWGQASVIATLPGKSQKTIILSAHQDSINMFLPSLLAAPGADDDGSGTVTILESLRGLLKSDDILNGEAENTIEFHWYSAEEGGLLGSQAVFQSYEKEGYEVVAMLHQDMTGYVQRTLDAGQPESIGVLTDYVHPGLTDFVKKLITEYCDLPYVMTKCGYACSDHASATKAGYPSSCATEADFQYFNNKIHTTNDRVELLDFNHMLQHAKLATAFAYELAFAKFD